MENNGKVLLALLGGVAAGIAIGILLAPQKGSDSRQKINETVKDLVDSVIEKAEEVIDNLNSEKKKA